MDSNDQEILKTPQAKFLINVLKRDHPEFSELQLQELVIEKLRPDTDEDYCSACGS
jgi:hypothetical protein